MLEFFSMGGYALYVWGSYGAAALLILVEVFLSMRNRKSLVAQLRRTLASLERVEP
ncbi:MAG TPA: heme exporter protein CcmD [Gammaproteobacteria bacterium]|nr:heme exporter protein CcmD [Gammaproteobacteria bacterium]